MLSAAGLLLVLSHTVAPGPRDSTLARTLYWAALDQEVILNLDSALILLQAARRADRRYFPAQFAYIDIRHTRYEEPILRRESALLARSADPADRCVAILIDGFIENRDVFGALSSLAGSSGATTCSTYALAAQPPRRDLPDSLRLAFYARTIRDLPEWETAWAMYAGFLERSRQWVEAERVLERGRATVRHPLARMRMTMQEVGLRLARGDTAAAFALRRSVRAAMERDGRPGLRAVYEDNPCSRRAWSDSGDDPSAEQRRVLAPMRVAGDWAWTVRSLIGCGHALLDRGEMLEALEPLTTAVAIADSVRLPDLYLELYLQRGRTLAKLGRNAGAERDLQRALGLGAGAGRLYNVADAYQQLAEMYEGAGRWADAVQAADRFVALARPMWGVLRISSMLDAGEIRWKAGWHASARAAFDEMVRAIDALDIEHFWAGEYYERIGDVQLARRYYTKASREYGWNSRGQSGLARVYEALGQLDSAEAVARVHDSQEAIWPPLEMPLMPAILERRGRSGEALRVAGAWADRQESRGNLRGALVAQLRLSHMALAARSAAMALGSAARADSLARSLHLANERIQALTVRGIALAQLGLRDSALDVLGAAAAMARRESTADNLLETHLALGDALAERGRVDEALAAYDRAAQVAERGTASLMDDLDRARYRDRHLLPFDGAIAVLARVATRPGRLDQLIAWSARRKAASLLLATNAAASVAAVSEVHATVADVRRGLGASDALLDYVVLDSTVGVIVVTRAQAAFTRLSISKDSLAKMVDRLRRPLVTAYGGRVDLVRARFDLQMAAALYAALVRPLVPLLAGTRRLIVAPDGPLHALSFDALVTTPSASGAGAGDYATAGYLVDAYEVEYVPSASVLMRRASTRVEALPGSRLLVVSYGAPGGDRETAALRASWPAARTTVLEGMAATEHASKVAMPLAGVIHFAVHAQASARDPLASHLRLAPDSVDDGYLNLGEIAAAKITARLVVLSGCETDAGPIYNGEGVMGLARAFLAAGAHAVVGTQWPVAAEMAELMGELYRRLATGEAPATALRAAKLTLRSKRETAHPFFWAAPVLVSGGSER